MKKYLFSMVLAFLFFANNLLATEQWEVFNTYKTYTQLEEFHGKLFVRSGNSVFVASPDDETAESFTQLNGLSSSSILMMAKSEEADVLAFIHNDGIIDLLDAELRVSSIQELKNKSIVGNKTINNARTSGKKLYLACGFGFVEVDIPSQLISKYHYTPSDCKFAFSFANSIYYALVSGGLWRCDIDKNMSIDTNWSKTEEEEILDVTVFDYKGTENCWIIDKTRNIHILNPDGSHKKSSKRGCYQQLKHSGDYVFSKGWGFDIISVENQTVSYVQKGTFNACRDYYSVNDTLLFAVHPELGLVKLSIEFKNHDQANISQLTASNTYYEIAGDQISELSFCNGVLAGISGFKLYSTDYTKMYLSNASINFYADGEWSHLSESQVRNMPLASKEFRGLTGITADPAVDHRFIVSTLTTGIYQFDKDSLTKHMLPVTNVKSVHIDDEGILWAAKALNDSTIWSYDSSSDEWTFHNISNFSQQSNVGRMFRQKYEQHRLIWALNNYPYRKSRIGILYNTTASNGNTKDDQSAYITSFQDQDGNQYSLTNTINTVYDMHEDREGKIWLLTNIGPFVVDDVVKTFNYAQKNPGIGLVTRIKVPRNDGTNLADYLLSTTECSAMVTDNYNRKWIGTLNNGLYLISSDGMREITHFTTENAPLLTNTITALAYDEEDKRLFIAGSEGFYIYHSDTFEPAEDFSSFHCFPNPLRPDYYGNVEIVGLMKDSHVSITDATGNLIWKTFCEDGNTSWDGRDNDGNRVAPGVYLIHGISEASSKGSICKLLVL